MNTNPREFWCWTCLDFEHLPGIGPCPDCRPDAYTEHITAWADEQATEGSEVA
jgi:hypothetical protein